MRVRLLIAAAVVGLLTSQGALCEALCAAQPDPTGSRSLTSSPAPAPCHEMAGSESGSDTDREDSEDCPSCSGQTSFLRAATDAPGSTHGSTQFGPTPTLLVYLAAPRAHRLYSGSRFEPPPRRTPLLKSSLLL